MNRKMLEQKAREIGERIGEALPPGIGFSLLVFDFGEGGHLAYISNAERETMIKAMKEWIARAEAGMGARDTDS